ncbi:MAG TPA: rhodanese-like domain-containing protein [Solirubrobacteraceae bacterium]|nr:rhodanese-like domain-containing protein [Solirubrobacteraceae bacterium]
MLRKLFAHGLTGPSPINLDPTSAYQAISAGGACLVDVREPSEFAAGHPVGALNVPLSTLPGALHRLPAGPLVLSCESGARSRKAGKLALKAGRTDVHSITGGYLAWDAAGLPTETGA